MKNRMRIVLGVVLAVFTFSVAQTVFAPMQASAAGTDNAAKLQAEAKTYSTYWGILRNCIQGGTDTDPGLKIANTLGPQSGTGTELRDNQLRAIFANNPAAAGLIGEHVDKDDGQVRCNNSSDMDKYLPLIGIKNTSALIDLLYGAPDPDGNRTLKLAGYQTIIRDGINARNEKAEPGPDGAYTLSDGARWYLYYMGLKNSDCGFTDDMSDADIAGSSNKTAKIWVVEKGEVVQKNGVLKDLEESVLGWGVWGDVGANKTEDTAVVSCGDILDELATLYGKGLATIFAAQEKEDIKNGGSSLLDGADSGIVNQDVDPCEASGYTLSWVICSGIKILDDLAGWFGDQLVLLLRFNLSTDAATNPDSQDRGLYLSWTSFRGIANVLLIIITLIIIISQIISIESLSAYTVKKAIPRLVIVAILIQLSWFVVAWLVGLIQALGDVTKDLVLAPFARSGVLQDLTFGDRDTILTFVGGGGAALASGIGLWGSLGTILIAITFAVLAAFFVVLVRYLVIVACIVAAPLAFICWILPNTQGVFKAWWGFFTKSLLMYPLIVMLLVSGRIASSLILGGFASGASIGNIWTDWSVAPWLAQTSGDGNTFIKLAAVAAYFAPYMMIPFTFKFAGGLVSTVGGMVNDRSRGMLDMRKKRNSEANAGRRAANATGNRFKEGRYNYAAKTFNRVGGGLGAGVGNRFGFGARGREAYTASRSAAQEERLRDSRWVHSARRDDVVRAATYGSEREAREGLTSYYQTQTNSRTGQNYTEAEAAAQAQKTAKRAAALPGGFTNREAAFKQMVMNGTAFTDARDVAETIARVGGGSTEATESLWGFNKAKQKEAMRHELSGVSMEDISDARSFQTERNADRKAQLGAKLDVNKHRAHLEGAKSIDNYSAGKLKGNSIKNLTESAAHVMGGGSAGARSQEEQDNHARLAAAVMADVNDSTRSGTLGNAFDAEAGRQRVIDEKSEFARTTGGTSESIDSLEEGVIPLRSGGRELSPDEQARRAEEAKKANEPQE